MENSACGMLSETRSTWLCEPIKQVRVYDVLYKIRIRISGCVVLLDPTHAKIGYSLEKDSVNEKYRATA